MHRGWWGIRQNKYLHRLDVGQNSRIFSRHRPNPSFLNNPLSYCYCYSRSLISTKIKFLTSALQFIQRNSLITSKVLKENSVMWLHCEMRTEEYIITSSQNELDNVLKTFYLLDFCTLASRFCTVQWNIKFYDHSLVT